MEHRRKFLLGSFSNMAKGLVSVIVMLVLPPLLVHRLTPSEYGAWVIILQCSAYIALLDLSLQTAIGKFVAQFHALDDRDECSRTLSSSFVLLCFSALLGLAAVGILTWRVPQLFHQVPASVAGSLREGLFLVGLSTALSLPSNSFIATFTGLQEYGISTALWISSKTLSTVVLIVVLLRHGTLVELASVVAVFNIVTAIARYYAWRMYARERAGFSVSHVHRGSMQRLAKYSAILSLSVLGVLIVSGLDLVIVGHYDYKETAYYGVATEATSFMILVISSVFGPLIPAISSLQSRRTPAQLGEAAIKATRYCTLLICMVGLPLLVGAYPLLTVWVGSAYAIRSAVYLRVLVLGNAIRLLGYPYSLVIVATGKLHLATIAAVAEAVVNFGVSIYLVQRMGAIGVAIGTVVGAVVSVALHLLVSMKFTRPVASIPRRRFVLAALLRPLSCAIPSLIFVSLRAHGMSYAFTTPWVAVWIATTLGVAFMVGLLPVERSSFEKGVATLVQKQFTQV